MNADHLGVQKGNAPYGDRAATGEIARDWRSSTPDAVGREAGVELEEAFVAEGLEGAVARAGIRELAVRSRLHLLDAGLHKIEWQTAGGGAEACNDCAAQNDGLASGFEPSSLQHLFGLQSTVA